MLKRKAPTVSPLNIDANAVKRLVRLSLCAHFEVVAAEVDAVGPVVSVLEREVRFVPVSVSLSPRS